MSRPGLIHGLVSWFDCVFEDPKKPHMRVILPTSPYSKPTHWKQTTFYLDLVKGKEITKDTPPLGIPVKKYDTISGSIACVQSKTNFRELDVKISYNHMQLASSKPTKIGIELYKVR